MTKYSKRNLKKKTGLGRTCLEKVWVTDEKSNRGKPSREATAWKTRLRWEDCVKKDTETVKPNRH